MSKRRARGTDFPQNFDRQGIIKRIWRKNPTLKYGGAENLPANSAYLKTRPRAKEHGHSHS